MNNAVAATTEQLLEQRRAENNIALWEKVCKTDPAHTKGFVKGGGFKGTAIKPFWLMRRATEVFGVCGIGWGWEEIESQYRAGVWCSKVRVWFIVDDKEGGIEQWGQTVMEGANSKGPFVDEEAPKKAVTDAVTKCLSYLGFAGDVHMGLFDDSKYIDEMNLEFGHVITNEQAVEIDTLIGEVKADKVSFLKYIGVEDVRKIPVSKYQHAKESLNKKKVAA